MRIYSLPPKIKTDTNGYDFLAGLYEELAGEEHDVKVDFSKCQYFDGNMSAVIGAIFDKLTLESYNVYLTPPTTGGVKRTLSRNHFFREWNIQTDFEEREKFVDYKCFPIDGSDDFKAYIDSQLIHKQRFPQHSDLVGKMILESIYEIYANATMHGNSSSVTCCGEYSENDKTLHMTIVDCGLTISDNVNTFRARYDELPLSDCEAIEWAFIEGNTTKDNTGGLGLSLLKDFIGMNDGSLDFVSGKGFMRIKGKDHESFILNKSFPGTIVNMNFNFDDDKNYYMTSEMEKLNINDLL